MPSATVEPMARSTGTLEEASTPKPMTVVALASASEANTTGAGALPSALRSKNSA